MSTEATVYSLFKWAAMKERVRNKDDLVPALIRRFSMHIIGQYFFDKQIPLAMFPLHHIYIMSNLQNSVISGAMHESVTALLGGRFSESDDALYQVIYQYSIYYNLQVLRYRYSLEVQGLFNKYITSFHQLGNQLRNYRSTPTLPRECTEFESKLKALNDISRELDSELAVQLRPLTALVSTDLARTISNVVTYSLNLQPSIFNDTK